MHSLFPLLPPVQILAQLGLLNTLRRGFGQILQLFLVGQKAAGFHRKEEIGRSRLSPIVEGGFSGKTIEAVVQFNGVELTRVKFQHFIWRYFCRVKRAPPMLVVIPGCADANVTLHEQRNLLSLCCGTSYSF